MSRFGFSLTSRRAPHRRLRVASVRAASPRRHGRKRLLATGLVGFALWIGSPAAADTLFQVDSQFSSLTIENASFNATASTFQSMLRLSGSPTRSVAGTLTLDDSGALLEASLQLLGDPLTGLQVRLRDNDRPIFLGDFTLTALAVSIDASGFADMTGGTIEFDLSLGSSRVSSPFPFSLAGCCAQAQTMNTGGPPIVTPMPGGDVAVLPVQMLFENLTVIAGGETRFTLFGVIQATEVPEASTFTMLTLGLLALVGCGRRTTR